MATANAITFLWEGMDRKGSRIKGESQAASEILLKADLRRQGINPLKVKKKPKPLFGSAGKAIVPRDIAIFARQLATMMTAGVPLVQSFEIIGRGHDKPAMQDLVLGIKADIEAGTSLAEALEKQPKWFDDLFVSLVGAGEQSGALEALLDKIATYKEKTEELKAKVKKALFYPIAVLVVAFIVCAILLLFVVPQFESIFQGFGADLPAFTKMVINLSAFFTEILVGGIFWYWHCHILVCECKKAFTCHATRARYFLLKDSYCWWNFGKICHCTFCAYISDNVYRRCSTGRSNGICSGCNRKCTLL